MAKIIDDEHHQIDVSLFLEDITPEQTETLLGGYCQFLQGYPYIHMGDIAEMINNAKQQSEGLDKKSSNQKINTIDNSKKTYVNGVLIPTKDNTIVIVIKG